MSPPSRTPPRNAPIAGTPLRGELRLSVEELAAAAGISAGRLARLIRLGLDDYFFGDGVSVVEWADRFPEFIPEQARWILFGIKSETTRAVTLK